MMNLKDHSALKFMSAALVATFIALTMTTGKALAADGESTKPLSYLPVQNAGRVKPLESLARESLQLVYGRETYKTPTGEVRPALEIVMTWMLVPAYWDNQKIIEITHQGLKDSLTLDKAEKYFSPNELLSNGRMSLVMGELAGQREKKEKLTPYYQAVQRLESQLGTYQQFKNGKMMQVVPPAPGAQPAIGPNGRVGEAERWLPVAELTGEMQGKFATVIRAFIQALPANDANPGAAKEKDPSVPPLAQAVEDFKTAARNINPAAYPSERDIDLEVHLKVFQPFKWAWIFYLLAAIVVAVGWQTDRQILYKAGWTLVGVAFLLHCYGFFLRMYLTGRPPVSNMYESVVWVSFGAVVLSMILEAMYRRRFILIAGACVGTICLIIADMAPAILDQSLQPLEPVLRSNYWLTIHVLTITLSYSCFFVAWAIGNIGLGFALRGEKPTSERVRAFVLSLYRAIQVGVVLLAAGIILGGIWADYSWGRFWGWDPKETWALIALLGYLAMLHGRLVGWIQNLGMLASSVIAFNLVIMAWYGVNYVLGAGLHTYGFGAGGVQYVAGFVILNLIYVGYAIYVNRSSVAAQKA